jgi:SAM-dependent MidA family methyltransferase
MEQALYGPAGFFRRGDAGPREHFRTSVHATDLFAAALLRLVMDVDHLLGHPTPLTVVDVGAGRGELLRHIADLLAAPDASGLAVRIELVGVEVADRPRDLPASIRWTAQLPEAITGVIIANEWLDNVPLDVVSAHDGAWQLVLVDPVSGNEGSGGPPSRADAQWLARWWPRAAPDDGERAEIGSSRDHAWADAVRRLDRGLALAIDFAHDHDSRADGFWAAGTLTGYRQGRDVAPVPDGTCDITAHVALDSCASAGSDAGASHTLLTSQRTALRALGLRGARPPLQVATDRPSEYVAALARASQEAELIDADGLGRFSWLVQTKEIGLPRTVNRLAAGPGWQRVGRAR